MAKGLICGAIASGLGSGLADASSKMMQIYGTSMLQKERMAMEEKRLALMQGHAEKMQDRGLEHSEKMQERDFEHSEKTQERGFEHGDKAQERGFSHSEKMQESQQAFTSKQTEREHELAEESSDKGVQRKEAADKRERDRQRDPDEIKADISAEMKTAELLTSNPAYMKALQDLAAAKETPGERTETAMRVFQLEASKEAKQYLDEYVKAVDSGDADKIATAKRAYEAHAQEPWEADKVDATLAAQGLKEAGVEITRLSTLLKDAIPGTHRKPPPWNGAWRMRKRPMRRTTPDCNS